MSELCVPVVGVLTLIFRGEFLAVIFDGSDFSLDRFYYRQFDVLLSMVRLHSISENLQWSTVIYTTLGFIILGNLS